MFKSEEGFRSIFFNHHIVMLLVDPKTREIIEANNAAAKFYGWTAEKMKQMTIDDINALSAEQLQKNVNRAHNLEECHFILKHRLADGQIRTIEAFCGPVKLDNRQLLYSINFDITEKETIRLKQELDEERLSSVVRILKTPAENSQEILDTALEEAIKLTASKNGFIFRYDEICQDFSIISETDNFKLLPEDLQPLKESISQRRSVIMNDFQTADCLVESSRQKKIPVSSLLSVPVFSGNRIVAVIGVANKEAGYDQTDELQISLLMDAIWKQIENVESNKRIAHLNATLHSIYKIHRLINRNLKASDLAEKVCEAFLEARNCSRVLLALTDKEGCPVEIFARGSKAPDKDDIARMKTGVLPNCFIEALQSNKPVIVDERDTVCGDCPIWHWKIGQITIISSLKVNDELYGVFLISTDEMQLDLKGELSLLEGLAEDLALAFHNMDMRTAKRLAEKDRDSLQSQLVQAQKIEAIGLLAGGVAHDFNNLLSVILGYGEILMQDIASDSSLFEPMSEIYAAAERARNLTRQLLAFSRKQVFQVKLASINSVVTGFEKLLKRIIGEQIELKLQLCEDNSMVKVDVAQLEQAMMNLAINARDAMPGGGKLTIATDCQYLDERFVADKIGVRPGKYVLLSFTDTGTGMDEETIGHIFEPFFTTKGVETGTGLGLSTAYGIIKQHNGHIWVESKPGHGSTFRIFLPHNGGMSEPEKTDSVAEEYQESVHATILVVEDDLLVRRLACKILSRQGYRVFEAENYDSAVEIARSFSGKIDLLLTDVIMPGKEGPAVYKTVAEYCPDIRVIFMSGYSPTHIHHLCKLENFEEFIQKPISVSALLGKVSNILRKKRKGKSVNQP